LSSVEFKTQTNERYQRAVAYADYIIFAIPSAFVGAELEKTDCFLRKQNYFSAIKGIVQKQA
jgi:glycerol-3-phosphate dehydrogenase (NAD(P)+)